MNIFVNIDANPEEKAQLIDLAGEDKLTFGNPVNPDLVDKTIFREVEVVFGWCPPEWLNETTNLRWFQLHSVGFDQYTGLDWTTLSQKITCTNLKGYFATPVAETILAGILALYRGLDRLITLKELKSWEKMQIRPILRTLTGAKVVLVGNGTISIRLQSLLEPFKCQVLAFSRSAPLANLHSLEELDIALQDADIICLNLPDTPQTSGIFSRQRLALIKSGGIFVNSGRSNSVDEAALLEAVKSGAISGCVLDVTNREPLPPDDPWWDCPNTILTQHTGGGSKTENSGKIEFFAENLGRYRLGKPLLNVIDWEKGY